MRVYAGDFSLRVELTAGEEVLLAKLATVDFCPVQNFMNKSCWQVADEHWPGFLFAEEHSFYLTPKPALTQGVKNACTR